MILQNFVVSLHCQTRGKALSQVKQTKKTAIMKTIIIIKQFEVNGITYHPYTTLTKSCCKFIAENRTFPNIPTYWSTIIEKTTNNIAKKVEEEFKNTFGKEYIKMIKIYSVY